MIKKKRQEHREKEVIATLQDRGLVLTIYTDNTYRYDHWPSSKCSWWKLEDGVLQFKHYVMNDWSSHWGKDGDRSATSAENVTKIINEWIDRILLSGKEEM